MPSDLAQPSSIAGYDDQLLAHHTAPDLLVDVSGWRRVAHRAEADGLVAVDRPRLAQGGRIGLLGQHVQPSSLLDQGLGGDASGLAVATLVYLLAEPLTGVCQSGEARV